MTTIIYMQVYVKGKDRGQKSDVGGQRAEVGGREKKEVGGQRD